MSNAKKKIFRITNKDNHQDYGTLKELFEDNHMLIGIGIGALMNYMSNNNGVWQNELVKIERFHILPTIENNGSLEVVSL